MPLWYHFHHGVARRGCIEGRSRPRSGPAESLSDCGPPRSGHVRGTDTGTGPVADAFARPRHGPEQPRTAPRPASRARAQLPHFLESRARGIGYRPPAPRHLAVLRGHARHLPRVPRLDPHPPRRIPPRRELTSELQSEVDAAADDDRPCCGPSAASATATCCASASTTSSATGRSKRSPATSPASPMPPSRSPCSRPCQRSAALRHAWRVRWPASAASRSWRSASSAARS